MNKPSIPCVAADPRKLLHKLAPTRRLRGLGLGVSLVLGALCWALPAQAQFVITEFMAANNVTLNDGDGDNSDWIEIQNQGAATANLAGWFLTDTTNALAKWQFPATNVPPNGYLVVFASQKNRRTPGAPLHTNFKLAAGGDYLALVAPDGTNVVSQFAPFFPPQISDVSYGLVPDAAAVTLLSPGAPVRAFVPPNDNLGLTWTEVEFNDASWTNGTTGLGYDRQTIGVNYLPLIGLNVESLMYPNNASLYARVPFTVANPGDWSGLTLRLKFEDGFIAYLNGQEIARSNAPANATFNSVALAPRTDTSATNFVDFNVSEFRGFLNAGTNVLAFHALNNPTNSPDLLLLPQLEGLTPNGPPVARYFPVPTPGRANNSGVATLGPVMSDAQHTPAEPADADTLAVTARLRPAFAPVASATLRYRVMFGSEVSVPFLDDGAHGDGAAGDGVYGASIPASASTPGQMVRWYITATDTTGTNVSRYPAFTATNDSPAYLGTVIRNPALTNPLPVFHWFVQNVPATDTTTGTRASVYWNGEFYDNVFNRVRGASAPSFSKKPYKFDFNPGDHFRFQPGQPRVGELNLNATYQDKAYVRAPLSFETYRQAGSPAGDAFNVRVQQNNAFYSVAVFVEQVDQTYLERRGFDPNGALYKMFNAITSSTSVEKKTRRNENNSDLQELVAGLSLSNPNRGAFVYDRFDMPALINYLAAGVLIQDIDRVGKNCYLYRDTEGTGAWTTLPWDKDITFGPFGLGSDCLSGSDDSLPYDGCHGGRISHPLFGSQGRAYNGGVNNVFDAIYAFPATREMFLRRLRTLMDEYLQPPGTPPAHRFYERRLDELAALLQPDATLDFGRWRAGFGLLHNLSTAMSRLKVEYLDDRRKHLYQTHSVDNVGNYPDVAGIPHAQLGSPALTFGTIEFNPASSNQAQEYVELRNPNPVAVDLSGWRIEGGVDFTFAPGTVVPANGRIYVSPDIAAFRTRMTGPRAGQSLLVVGNYCGQLSARGESLTLRDATGLTLATTNYLGSPSTAQQFLRITELMYHPSPLAGNTNAADEFEFIELKNISTNVTLDLRGVRFVNGVEFSFTGSAVTTLAPGAKVLVVKNLTAFTARYGGGLPVAGPYLGALDNAGERIQLLDASGEEVLDFSYDDNGYRVTDGLGFSLVIVSEFAEPDSWNSAANWRPSGVLNGSPAFTDPGPPVLAPIVINEVLSRTDLPPPTDSIELFNPTTSTGNIGGWFLSDDFNTPMKFRIPNGTTIPAGGFMVFTEADFNPGGLGFAFSSLGDEAWLFSGGAQTNLTGYVHGFRFGAAENGVSFGRHLTSVGEEHFVAQSVQTLNNTNSSPRVGPVVISEIHYHPSDSMAAGVTRLTSLDVLLGLQSDAVAATADELEFIELQNITSDSVSLFDPLNPTNTWRLRGDADFDFPTNVTLAPGATLLLVNFNPISNTNALAAFRTTYGLDGSVPLFGPYSGSLDNSSARVELQKSDAPNSGTVPRIVVDTVHYGGSAPWPAGADGFGLSLQRRNSAAYGNDPANWTAVLPTPGTGFSINGIAPIITLQPESQMRIAYQNVFLSVTATGSELLRYQWRFNGSNLDGATNAFLELNPVQPEQAGDYQAVVYNSVGSVVSSNGTLTLLYPAAILAQPQSVTARPGSNVTFSVLAFGSTGLSYQWQKNGVNLTGSTGSSLSLPNVQPADNAAYTVVVSDTLGSVASAPATLTILINPSITQSPVSQVVVPGSTVVLSVSVTNTATLPIGYRLRRNNVTLPATPANFITLNERTAYFTLSGTNTMPPWSNYAFVVTNAAFPGGTLSASAILTYATDSDGDGLPDAWEADYFGSATGANLSVDSDGDGMTNGQEYIAGTDPTNALSYLRLDLTTVPSHATIQFSAVSNRTYAVQFIDAIGTAPWSKLADIPARATNRLEFIPDPAWTSNRFYRVRTPFAP